MYEGITYDKLVKGMLDTALAETSAALDTREGSMLWYGVAPAAVELNNLYIQLDWVLDQSFADTATRPYLIRRAAERGMAPYAATPSVIRAMVASRPSWEDKNSRTTPDRIIRIPRQSSSPDQIICPAPYRTEWAERSTRSRSSGLSRSQKARSCT